MVLIHIHLLENVSQVQVWYPLVFSGSLNAPASSLQVLDYGLVRKNKVAIQTFISIKEWNTPGIPQIQHDQPPSPPPKVLEVFHWPSNRIYSLYKYKTKHFFDLLLLKLHFHWWPCKVLSRAKTIRCIFAFTHVFCPLPASTALMCSTTVLMSTSPSSFVSIFL